MRKLLTLSALLFACFYISSAQTYNLSKETIKEYREIMEEYEDMAVGEKVLAIGAFYDIYYELDIRLATAKIVIDGADWSQYTKAIQGYKSFVHERMATVCGANAVRSRISKNADDRKFWQKLYEYHMDMR